MKAMSEKERKGVSRREFLKVAGAGAVLTEVLTGCKPGAEAEAAPAKSVHIPQSPNRFGEPSGQR